MWHETGRPPMMTKSGKKGRAAGFFAGKMGKAKAYIRAQNVFLNHAFQREEARNNMPIDGVAFYADMNERGSGNCQKISLLLAKESI